MSMQRTFRHARQRRLPLLLSVLSLCAGCVAPKQVEAPLLPVAVPAPPPPPPVTTDWRDIPLTPGDWRYDQTANDVTVARFGRGDAAPEFTVRCDRATQMVSLGRVTAVVTPATMAITTSAGNRTLAATPVAGPPAALVATIPARDGFLDRMAFSRGRFVVAVAGTPRLVIPAWPEFARVIEDCRG